MKVFFLIIIVSLVIGIIVDYVFRNAGGAPLYMPAWFIPVMTVILATFIATGYRLWVDHW
jgi:hypothetical protein